VGRRIKLTHADHDAPWHTIVGVVGDTYHAGLDATLRPQVYVHQQHDPMAQMVVVLRTAGEPAAYAPLVRSAVSAIDRNQPVSRIRPMAAIVEGSVARQRFTMALVGTFAALALLLALVGLYAVMAHAVAERTAELGVRLAIGATPGAILQMVLSESLRIAALGTAAGLAAGLVVARSLEALLFGVRAWDPLTFVLVPILLLLAAALGSAVPAWRAMRVDPMVVIRSPA
jgi:putative ABC transport system permease protein